MRIELEQLYDKIKALIKDRLTGSITVHFSEGVIMKVEIKEVTRSL
jgi:hypothetical protein